MLTIYDLLEIEEDASKGEIEKAYSKMVLEFRQDIKFDEKTNKENELIINKLKIAYEILTDDEKRKKYDYQLAQKRAESLLENVSVSKEEVKEEINVEESRIDNVIENSSENKQRFVKETKDIENEYLLSKDEKKEIRKAAEKEFKNKLKKAKQAEEEYREAYNKAYNSYLRKNGYTVKEPWTLKRVKRMLILILILGIIGTILWFTLPIKENLIKLYEENFIVKMLVDFVKSIINAFKK